MPTGTLLRSLMFTSVMSSPLLEPCLAMMKLVVNSQSPVFDPRKNPIVDHLLRATIYNHFCAGTDEAEVRQSVKSMKDMGYKGVILGYAREVVVNEPEDCNIPISEQNQQTLHLRAVEEWKLGNLQTLKMIGPGDYLSMKFTGAGPVAVEALSRGDPIPPACIQHAMDEICEQTARQGSRLWIDAEQQVFQHAIDKWTIGLMRKYNGQGKAVVFNTIQAYLKSSAQNVHHHLQLAQQEGWTLGIKLVRGAYIAHDIRSRIHDTKQDTDRNYNHIIARLLSQQSPLDDSMHPFPDVRLFVAGHNAESVHKACTLHRSRIMQGQPTIPTQFGQLQGMADNISCELLAEGRRADPQCPKQQAAVPQAFKALAWGSTSECLHFLLRRAVENKGAVERTRHMADALRMELWRRLRSD
ncbi:hypothetical protein ASPZODRAFT_149647 [Penicilliopsis zonata CBS 506.65]|uniref:Proline dehydrogenase n=1 Tax=Penicilliopsis zonata CBS 506.65 TaxID=1073090 RepID=A0A1L9ST19_9EURO|nr:hypothetical protein ASPZODRAFT_149647 [Penicilliopsis zonata CBS 506.65]OJJ50286.1 hypothetical protein ASPZODRAFT_149647 [Penicilliopsis zonata CBS 506.65]